MGFVLILEIKYYELQMWNCLAKLCITVFQSSSERYWGT